MAAEMPHLYQQPTRSRRPFNEAAAHGRGKSTTPTASASGSPPSMRPRRMAAKNFSARAAVSPPPAPFNEAAAHGRGKWCRPPPGGRAGPSFNEAAAHGRGKCGPTPAKSTGRRRPFNEAAAHGRGKCSSLPRLSFTARAFNEAAAHGRGKCKRGPGTFPPNASFNEAAAHGRGKCRSAVRRTARRPSSFQ